MPKVRKSSRKKIGPYNRYMKTELVKVKEENPNINQREAFVMVAKRWKDAPENPKNQPKEEDKNRLLASLERAPLFLAKHWNLDEEQVMAHWHLYPLEGYGNWTP